MLVHCCRWQRKLVASLALLSVLVSADIASETTDYDRCLTLGYTNTLECNTCDLLYSIVNNDQLYNECKSCCTSQGSQTDIIKQYNSVTLRVCS